VFRTTPGATVAAGLGPYCTNGASCESSSFVIGAQTLNLIAVGSTTSVVCSRLDGGGLHASARGLSAGAAASTFVGKAGDTMTGTLTTPNVTTGAIGTPAGIVQVFDTGGTADLEIGTASSASGGAYIKILDPRTTLAATACDSDAEVGIFALFSTGTSLSLCACEKHSAVFGWFPMAAGVCV
jgi:hypothetical protein